MSFTTSDNNYGVAKWIVDPILGQGTHQTISAALSSASSGDTIFIRPGTYTENPTLKAGVNLTAFTADAQTPNVIIKGKCSASFTGTCTISGIQLRTNGDFCLSVTGSNITTINLYDCFINGIDNTALSMNSSGVTSQITLSRCQGSLGVAGATYFTCTSGEINFQYCEMPAGSSTTASTANTGTTIIVFNYTVFSVSVTTANSNTFQATYSQFTSNSGGVCLTLNGTGPTTLDLCYVNASSFSAISVGAACGLIIFNSEILSNAVNAITGAGSITYGGLSFIGSSSTINTTTKVPTAWTVLQGGTGLTSTTINNLLYSSAANTIANLATANNGTLITSSGGVPSISSTLPSAVQGNITSVGALASGSLTTGFTAVGIAQGGTNATSFTQSNGIVTYNGTRLVNYAGPQLSSGGVQTNTSQPAFNYYLSAQDNNSIGGSATYTLGSANVLTQLFDNGSNCSTAGVFTAPVTGRYLLGVGMALDFGSTTTQFQLAIVANGVNYLLQTQTFTALESTFQTTSGSVLVTLSATQTATATLFANGAKNGDVRSGQGASFFWGYLVC